MIESNMLPVIIPFDAKAKKAVDELSIEQISSGKIARQLQNYIVQVPPKARELLLRNGHVSFERPDLRGDQFAVLRKDSLYDREVGLFWERPDYLAIEDMIL
jgi:CRISPR-associated endonuclease/helicase Cas3